MGALTSKPYAFTARSWELKSFYGLDFFDGLLTSVRYDLRGSEVMRILPRKTESEVWITDKVRFMYDALRRQRLYKPHMRVWKNVHSVLVPVSWLYILQCIAVQKSYGSYSIDSFSGGFVDLETQLVLKEFTFSVGGTFNDFLPIALNIDFRHNFIFDFIAFDNADLVLLLGCDLRFDAPLLNVKLRKRVNLGITIAARFGFNNNLTYESFCFGSDINFLLSILVGKSFLSILFSKISNGFVLFGDRVVTRSDSLISVIKYFVDKLSFRSSFLSLTASSTGLYDVGVLKKSKLVSSNWLYLLDFDKEFNCFGFHNFFFYDFIIYQGHHGDLSANFADIILPGVSPLERDGSFIDICGNLKKTKFITPPFGESRIDWRILVSLSDFLNIPLLFRDFYSICTKLFVFGITLKNYQFFNVIRSEINFNFLISCNGIQSSGMDFYLADSITRSSLILALVSFRSVDYNKIWW